MTGTLFLPTRIRHLYRPKITTSVVARLPEHLRIQGLRVLRVGRLVEAWLALRVPVLALVRPHRTVLADEVGDIQLKPWLARRSRDASVLTATQSLQTSFAPFSSHQKLTQVRTVLLEPPVVVPDPQSSSSS